MSTISQFLKLAKPIMSQLDESILNEDEGAVPMVYNVEFKCKSGQNQLVNLSSIGKLANKAGRLESLKITQGTAGLAVLGQLILNYPQENFLAEGTIKNILQDAAGIKDVEVISMKMVW